MDDRWKAPWIQYMYIIIARNEIRYKLLDNIETKLRNEKFYPFYNISISLSTV